MVKDITKGRKLGKRTTVALMFLLPGFCMFCFSVLIPFLRGLYIAFTDWNGITKEFNYVGLQNFKDMFFDARLRQPFINSLKFACIGTVGSNIASLGLPFL